MIILLATWGVGLSWPGVGGLTRPDAGYCVEQPEEDEDEVIRAGTGFGWVWVWPFERS